MPKIKYVAICEVTDPYDGGDGEILFATLPIQREPLNALTNLFLLAPALSQLVPNLRTIATGESPVQFYRAVESTAVFRNAIDGGNEQHGWQVISSDDLPVVYTKLTVEGSLVGLSFEEGSVESKTTLFFGANHTETSEYLETWPLTQTAVKEMQGKLE